MATTETVFFYPQPPETAIAHGTQMGANEGKKLYSVIAHTEFGDIPGNGFISALLFIIIMQLQCCQFRLFNALSWKQLVGLEYLRYSKRKSMGLIVPNSIVLGVGRCMNLGRWGYS